jgi:hypothetical protein
MRHTVIVIGFLLLGGNSSYAQRERVTQGVEWFGTSSAIKLAPQFGLYLDGQYRFAKSMDNMQHQFRIAPEIYVNNKLTISPVGYVYIWNFIYGDQPAAVINNEHRLYQELKFKHAAGKFSFTHRFRTEERFIQFHSGNAVDGFVDEKYDKNVQLRLRHRVWVNYALNGDRVEAKTWYIPALVEAFVSWGNPAYITYEGKLDQLRLYTGIGYQLNKNANIQVGPFYQMLIKAKGDKQENNIGSYIQLNWNFDFTKPAAVK